MRGVSGLRQLHTILPPSPSAGGIIREVINPCSAVLGAIYSKADKQHPAEWARPGVEITPGAIGLHGSNQSLLLLGGKFPFWPCTDQSRAKCLL